MQRLAASFRAAGSPARGLRKELRKTLAAAGKPIQKKVQSNARAIPAKRPYKRGGLRDSLARSTRLSVKVAGRDASVRVTVDGSKMPAGKGSLPAYMEGSPGYERWRHPVFGDPAAPWEQQDAHPFVKPVERDSAGAARVACVAAVETTTKKLAKGNF